MWKGGGGFDFWKNNKIIFVWDWGKFFIGAIFLKGKGTLHKSIFTVKKSQFSQVVIKIFFYRQTKLTYCNFLGGFTSFI